MMTGWSRQFCDLTGQRFGRLVAVGVASRGRGVKWEALCDCGAKVVTNGYALKSGATKSCGCLSREMAHERNKRHGDSPVSGSSKEYHAWENMKARCLRPSTRGYKNYGGRGITVCPRWRVSYEAFLADVGRAPSPALTLDRIDNDKGYLCGHWACCDGVKNVRWATRLEQNNNKRQRNPRRAA